MCAIAGWPLTPFSTQQVMDCNPEEQNCDGGNPTVAYEYIIRNEGLQPLSTYPNKNSVGTKCLADPHLTAPCHPVGWVNITHDEAVMQRFVFDRSPIEVLINVDNWLNYKRGVITTKFCGGNEVDHSVVIVGWTTFEPSWIVRNVWGPNWGYGGYAYVAM